MRTAAASSALTRYPLALLVAVMAVVATGSATVVGYRLYQEAMAQQRLRLLQIVENQAYELDAIVRAVRANRELPDQPVRDDATSEVVLAPLREAQGKLTTFGNTSEFTVARRDGDDIVFLLNRDQGALRGARRVAAQSGLAEPMQRALAGDAGVMVGLDYSGVRVLAAYHPVAELDAGVVAKIDLAEIRRPFVRTTAIAGAIALLLVAAGSVLLTRIAGPILTQVAESERRFRTLVEQSPAVTYVHGIGTSWRSIYLSPRVEKTLGSAARDWAAGRDSYLARVHPEDRAGAEQAVLRGRSGEGFSTEYRLVADDGREIWVQDEGVVLFGDDGTPTAVQGLLLDITDRKIADAKLARLAAIVDHVADAVLVTDTSGTIEYVNPALELASGYSREEMLGETPRLFKSGVQDPEVYEDLWKTITAGEVWRGRLVNRRKDGSTRDEDATISPILDDDGMIAKFVCVTRDVTVQVGLEAQLRQSQKMQVIGQLAGGVAHDFNNLLTGIAGYAELVLSELPPQEQMAEDQQRVLDLVDRATRLTRQLLLFSRRESFGFAVLDLDTMIDKSLGMLRRMVGEKVELQFGSGTGAGNVRADPDQIGQVLMNMVVNARDAMPGGGRIRIETEAVAAPPALKDRACDAGWVVVRINDTGHGMDRATCERVFEPFFTTKARGEGTGLGLATAYGIVEEHGGRIEVDSTVGEGSSFSIYLPLVVADVDEQTSNGADSITGGTETILVVEDEQQVRDILERQLSRCGYRPLMAERPADAKRLYAQHADEISLLLTDIVMPGQNGPDLYRSLAAQDPGLKVLFISGYNPDAADLAMLAQRPDALLQKPFGLTELAARVRQVLDT